MFDTTANSTCRKRLNPETAVEPPSALAGFEHAQDGDEGQQPGASAPESAAEGEAEAEAEAEATPLDGPLVPVMAALEIDALAHTAPEADGSVKSRFRSRIKRRTPEWFASFLASNSREKRRLRDELLQIKDAWPLLMKQRNGGKWTPEDKVQLKAMVRSASSVSPYLFIWAVPGSVLMLPFLAWFLDRKRRNRPRSDH